MELDESELINRCSAKDREAQKELYTRYAARIFTVCRRYCDNNQDAEDVLHDTFLIAFKRISTLTGKSERSLYYWLCRIAVNQAIDRIRNKRWQLLYTNLPVREVVAEWEENDSVIIPQEILLTFIARLPNVRRTVFNLYCIDGYTHKEIAMMLGISEKGSASILAKAKNQLKKEINRYLEKREK